MTSLTFAAEESVTSRSDQHASKTYALDQETIGMTPQTVGAVSSTLLPTASTARAVKRGNMPGVTTLKTKEIPKPTSVIDVKRAARTRDPRPMKRLRLWRARTTIF